MNRSTLPLHVLTAKIGENRGRARLWLQGRRLADIGAAVGSRFDLVAQPEAGRIVIVLRADGGRVVSGKGAGMPIIDAVGHSVGSTFRPGTRVRVAFEPGRIVVSIHPSGAAAAERVQRLVRKIQSGQPIATGAICFGAGILDAAVHEGLAQAGVRAHLRFAVDLDADALEHAMVHNPIWRRDTISIADDIAVVNPLDLPRVELLVAGLPCTAASRAGRSKQRHLDPSLRHPEGHEAGAAFAHLIRILLAVSPAVLLLENVPLYAETAGYACLVTTLRTLGYSISETTIASPAWGCIESRERFAMVASSGGAVTLEALAPNLPAPSLDTVLDNLPADDVRWRPHTHHLATVERDAAIGKNFRLQLVSESDNVIGTIGRGYSRDRRTEPHLRHPTDTTRSRLLTVREHARVKRVPEALIAGLGHTRGHQLLGQSVSYPPFADLGKRIGLWMRAQQVARPRVAEAAPAPLAAVIGEQAQLAFMF